MIGGHSLGEWPSFVYTLITLAVNNVYTLLFHKNVLFSWVLRVTNEALSVYCNGGGGAHICLLRQSSIRANPRSGVLQYAVRSGSG